MRIANGCYKMSSIDHLHAEAESKGTLKSYICTLFYLARCLEPVNPAITTTVKPVMRYVRRYRKATLHEIYTDAVTKVANSQKRNTVCDDSPPPIIDTEKDLTRK